MSFIILDIDVDPIVSFILGHPFLVTGCALIDVAIGRCCKFLYSQGRI